MHDVVFSGMDRIRACEWMSLDVFSDALRSLLCFSLRQRAFHLQRTV